MYHLWKLIFVLQFLSGYCTIYYDDENTPVEILDEGEDENNDVKMLIQGGYHIEDPLFDKYVVSIRTRMQTEFFGDNHFCAGTMIGSSKVLTAAHCLMDFHRIKTRPRRICIVAGTSNRLHHTSTTKEFEVKKIVIHPDFKRNNVHDIAVIMLRSEIPISNRAIRIMSLTNETPVINTTCLSAGWGQLFQYGPYAAKIVYAAFIIQPNSICEHIYGDRYNKESHICVWDVEKDERGVCFGDTGGPLVCDSRLAGIISWNVECGTKRNPIILTNVYAHLEWLNRVTNVADRIMSTQAIYCAFIFYCLLRTFSKQLRSKVI